MTDQAAKEQALREEFEKWAAPRFGAGMLMRASNGPYIWDHVGDAWAVWQAARASSPVAQTTWTDVNDALPPCDGEKVFIGINTAGHACCFNAIESTSVISCFYETAESYECLMSCLEWWRELDRTNASAPPSPGAAQGTEPVAWMVKQTFTEFFTDLEEACKYAMTIGATVVPLYASPPASPAPDQLISQLEEQRALNRSIALKLLENEREGALKWAKGIIGSLEDDGWVARADEAASPAPAREAPSWAEIAQWLHAAYDRPPQTPEVKALLARVDAVAALSPSSPGAQELYVDGNGATRTGIEPDGDGAEVVAAAGLATSRKGEAPSLTDEQC
jgi:hypothetical protein